ncbi:MAG TPA: PTS sugar transporter subunit IIA [Spirochaetota bacterium]|nr:PTS sugar transporter subunit IIA [Spirochaetota bacterium]
MELDQFFGKEQVIVLKNTEKQLIFKEMLKKLEDLGKIENADRFYAQVVHRESLENTGIGKGLAIPHARTESVDEFISIFAIAPDGIEYQSYDNIPVNYILLSIFPTSMSTKYLYLVGMMARIFSNDAERASIDEARTPAKMFSVLKKQAHQYFVDISENTSSNLGDIENLSAIPSANLDLIIRIDRLYKIYDAGDTSNSIQDKINQLRKLIDNRSLAYYERMRKKCQNPFAILDKGSCAGCHLVIPPVYLSEIKEKKGIAVCNNCGRFLIIL